MPPPTIETTKNAYAQSPPLRVRKHMQYRALFEAAPDAIVVNQSGTIVLVNAQAEILFGYRRAELIGQPAEILVSEHSRSQHSEQHSRFFAAPPERPTAVGLEFFGLRKDGCEFPAEIRLSPLDTELGTLVSSAIRDISGRRRTEEDLRRLASIVTCSDDAIIGKTLEGIITSWNAGAERVYGYSAKEAIGKPVSMLVPTDRPDEIPEVLERLKRGELIDHFETVRLRKDGKEIPVEITASPIRDAMERIVGASTIAHDISECKRHEYDLCISTALLKELTDYKFALDQHAIVAITDVQGTITYANDKFCAISQYPKEELIGQNHRILKSSEHPDEFFRQMYQTIANGEVWHGEIKNRAKDGSFYWVNTTIVPFMGAERKPLQYMAIRAVITERKRLEEILEQSRNNQLRFKDEFLSHVSHELRSPLTAIRQFTSILLGGLAGELNSTQREYQQIVLKNILQLQSMIDDLLEVTRLETGKLNIESGKVSVSDVVADTLNTLQGDAHSKGVILSCDLPPDLPSVFGDPTRFRQIMIILVDNAIKFTPSGGAVTIQVRRLELDPEFLLVEVADTGNGIGPEVVERIFERLYQESDSAHAARRGLGLGLYICKELVTRQGGQIWVKSQPSKGSVFSFTLPVFSLDNLIAPLRKNNKWPIESMALVVVEIRPRDAWSSEGSQVEAHDVRSLIQRCLMPDLDVLLPTMSFGAECERFFVAAFADERGASVLTNRIREQVERLLHVKETGLALSIFYRMMEPFPLEVGASLGNIVTSMVTDLEECSKSHNRSEAIRV